jgi:glycosyltransferase involved in cell wall biosynthesis
MVTFVGRLVPYKGLAYLIEAIYILKDRHDILFVIGGCGPEKDTLMNIAKSCGLGNIKFVGFVPDETLFNLFAASDVVVSPSISNLESTPISLLCALSTGTPVIGTEVGGTRETIPNDGSLGTIIPPRDSKKLAEAIIKMTGIKGTVKPEKYLLRFWSDVADDYLKIIDPMVRHNAAEIKKNLAVF